MAALALVNGIGGILGNKDVQKLIFRSIQSIFCYFYNDVCTSIRFPIFYGPQQNFDLFFAVDKSSFAHAKFEFEIQNGGPFIAGANQAAKMWPGYYTDVPQSFAPGDVTQVQICPDKCQCNQDVPRFVQYAISKVTEPNPSRAQDSTVPLLNQLVVQNLDVYKDNPIVGDIENVLWANQVRLPGYKSRKNFGEGNPGRGWQDGNRPQPGVMTERNRLVISANCFDRWDIGREGTVGGNFDTTPGVKAWIVGVFSAEFSKVLLNDKAKDIDLSEWRNDL